jgi:hypothetical protein
VAAGGEGRARGGDAARTAEELAARESSGGVAAWKNSGMWDGCGSVGRLRRLRTAVAARDSCDGAG